MPDSRLTGILRHLYNEGKISPLEFIYMGAAVSMAVDVDHQSALPTEYKFVTQCGTKGVEAIEGLLKPK